MLPDPTLRLGRGLCNGALNGVLVETNHFELKGETRYIGKPVYKTYASAPIKLQAHEDKSEPISFRNIWLRELD